MGVITRDGNIISMPEIKPEDLERMAEAIASEMIRLGKDIIMGGISI